MRWHHIGLSLIELLVAIAIFCILVFIAIPAMAELTERQQASAYMRQFSQHLAYARIMAVSSNLPVQLCPKTGVTCSADWQHVPIQISLLHPDSSIILLRQVPAISLPHKLVYNREQVSFRRDGSLDGFENGSFYYCPSAKYHWHYKMTLNQAGRSKLALINSACPS
ncbi:GspH/FimT family pseudopilin [Rheinheimera salexigens]|uniref:Type II secretion system protein H n=1 Tax=Rheinheimera salexigens TaxID=1628148 RepID=A0A1E7Q944_9GAMM|nr:GspH/FimT family pseudopilin [Rheinheimera salexigens]OEY70704.1 general secretion pathway protein GspH [Rheinheimera salexigens]